MHGGGWWSYIRYDEERDQPSVDRALLRRVLHYARPYRNLLVLVLITIVGITLISLLPPLLMRDLIDRAIPDENIGRVTVLGLLMVAVPLFNGVIGVIQRWASAKASSSTCELRSMGTSSGCRSPSSPGPGRARSCRVSTTTSSVPSRRSPGRS